MEIVKKYVVPALIATASTIVITKVVRKFNPLGLNNYLGL